MGDIAWTLASTALVWIMIPGVGFFYSGLLRRKNALNMIYLSMMTVAMVSFQVRPTLSASCALLTKVAVVFLGLFSSFQRHSKPLHWRSQYVCYHNCKSVILTVIRQDTLLCEMSLFSPLLVAQKYLLLCFASSSLCSQLSRKH